MTTFSYGEQLKHPNWQRKRLEILTREDFTCEACGAVDKTLHVHHKRYVKGRKVWQYDNDDLACLCEDCNAIGHEHKAAIEQELARLEPHESAIVHALLAGFRNAVASGPEVPEGMAEVTLFDGEEVAAAYGVGLLTHRLLNDLTSQELSDVLFVLRHGESFFKSLPELRAAAELERSARAEAVRNRPLDDMDDIRV